MELTISEMLRAYEGGKVSRRELVAGLTLLAARAEAQTAGFQGNGLNHVSLYVSDAKKSAEFYQKTFAGKIVKQDAQGAQVAFGKGRVTLKQAAPAARVDHFAIGVDGFKQDAVIADLKARGVVARQNDEFGLHVVDPDGYPVQLSGNE